MRAGATVLAYHGVGEPPPGSDPHNLFVSPAQFAGQLAYLARHRRVVPLSALQDRATAGDRRAVALTFDDGYRHLLHAALPELERYGFPSTVFVPSAHVGGRNTWDAPTAADLDIMDADDLLQAERRGMRVESHGHAHLDCSTATRADVEGDLAASLQAITDLVGRRPSMLAWPYRDGSPAAREVAAALGFQAAYSIDRPDAGPFSRARVQVTPRDSLRLFALKTSGRWTGLRYAPLLDGTYRAVRGVLRRGPAAAARP